MASSRDRAICLRAVKFSETSQILTLFCRRTGLLRAIAKGAHRRTKAGASNFDGGADLLDVGDCIFISHSNRDLATLTEWKLIEGHLALRANLRAMLIGQYLAEIIPLLLAEQDPHPVIFDRLRATLPALATARIEEEFLAIELDILRESGYLPDFNSCANCGGIIDGRVFHSPNRQGLLCRNCEALFPDRIELDPRLLRIADTVLKLPRDRAAPQRLPRLSRHQTNPLNDFIALQIQQIVQRPLHSAKYVLF